MFLGATQENEATLSSETQCAACQCQSQMWIYIVQLRTAPNALVSLVLREEMSLQSRLERVRTQRRVTEVSW